MADPVSTLASNKFNVPPDMTNPNDILQHLLNTGQISQDQVNRAMQMRNIPFVKKLFGG